MSYDKVQKVLTDLAQQIERARVRNDYDEENSLRLQLQGAHLVYSALFHPDAKEVAHLK